MTRKIVSYQAHGDTIDGALATNVVAQVEDGSLVFTGINIGTDGVSNGAVFSRPRNELVARYN